LRDGDGADLRVVTALERMTVAPFGISGGKAGRKAELVRADRHGTRSVRDRVLELARGESLTVRTAGGGGYGTED
jgi:N-methylhydantoinase B